MITPTAWRRLQHGTLLLMAFWVFPGFLACCVGNQQYTPVPSPSFDELTRVQTAPSGTGLQVGPEASVVSADGSSTAGAGVRCNCDTTADNVAVTFGGTKYFPEAGSAYGAFVAARYTRPSEGPAKVYGLAGPVWSRSGYSTPEYEIPTGEVRRRGVPTGLWERLTERPWSARRRGRGVRPKRIIVETVRRGGLRCLRRRCRLHEPVPVCCRTDLPARRRPLAGCVGGGRLTAAGPHRVRQVAMASTSASMSAGVL